MSFSFENVRKVFDGVTVLDSVSFACAPHSIVAVLGPSGAGKTTLLNMAAGLSTPDAGEIRASAGNVLGYMMQDALLLPWRTLEQNARLGAEIVAPSRDCGAQLRELLQALELWDERHKYPHTASGGMRQRVALARTLLLQPDALLLDEPFASLDFDIKLNVQRRLLAYHRDHGSTVLLVTHDIDDAIALSNEIIVLSDKPTKVKARITIDLGLAEPNPVEARKSPRFREYFAHIWDQLRYLDDNG